MILENHKIKDKLCQALCKLKLISIGTFGLICLIWQVWFGRFGFGWFCLVWSFEFVFLLQVMVPLKVAKTSLELHLETILGRITSVWSKGR